MSLIVHWGSMKKPHACSDVKETNKSKPKRLYSSCAQNCLKPCVVEHGLSEIVAARALPKLR